MTQIHKRASVGDVKLVLEKYCNQEIDIEAARGQLGLGRSRFFDLVKLYRTDSVGFSITYERSSHKKFSDEQEKLIATELKKEQELITNRDIPIRHFNYSSIRDALADTQQFKVSVPTIISRAKQLGYYLPKPERKKHTREVLTNYAGELIQHDASIHQWSPYIQEKFVAITSLDDYSRALVFADLFLEENSWNHIQAVKTVALQYGCPKNYYSDQHAIFRFVQNRDSKSQHKLFTQFTDDATPQWKQVLQDLGTGVIYALSPQAKGKIERPYRWLQDRTVRRCAKEGATTFPDVRTIFKEEVTRYNTRQVHSTTKEIPVFRLEAALNQNRSLFRPFSVPAPYETTEDVFAFRDARTVNGYGRISLNKLQFSAPGVAIGQKVDVRMAPTEDKSALQIRLWHGNALVGTHLVKPADMPQVRF